MVHLAVALLGPFRVTRDGVPLTTFRSHKAQALLAFLAAESHRPHAREAMAALLWPDVPDAKALRSLSYTLSRLRRAIGDRDEAGSFLAITRDTLHLPLSERCTCDLAQFEACLEAGDAAVETLRCGADLYRGSFLESFTLGDSAPFEQWVVTKREHCARLEEGALRRIGDHHEATGEWDLTAQCARRQLELDPWHEGAHRQYMRALTFAGHRGAALAHYDACRHQLAEELGVDPDDQTQALYEQILQGTLAPRETSAVPGTLTPALHPPPEAALWPAQAFVRREGELRQLHAYLEEVLQGRGRVAFVVGEPGCGKTYLLQEFARRSIAAHPDLVVAVGHCNAYVGIGDPYLPFVHVLRALAGDLTDQWPQGVLPDAHAGRLRDLLSQVAEVVLREGRELLGHFISAETLVGRLPAGTLAPSEWVAQPGYAFGPSHAEAPPQERAHLFEQYARLLGTLAQGHPLLLVLDDLQWADASSLSLLFHLSRSLVGSRVLVLGAYRPGDVALGRGEGRHPLEPLVNELQQAQGEVLVDLDRSNGREFIEGLLAAEEAAVPPGLGEQIHAQTRGHALFTVELLRGLRERGMLGRSVEGLADLWPTLPARVQGVIAERLGRLPEGLRRALDVASVQGEEFAAEVVARVLGVPEQESLRMLARALGGGVPLLLSLGVSHEGTQRLSRYRFRHYLYQSHLYRELDAGQRAYLHEDTARALKAVYGERVVEHSAELARHYEQAGVGLQAARYLAMSAERAYWLMSLEECVAYCQRGLALLEGEPACPERVDVELALLVGIVDACLTGYGWFVPEMEGVLERAESLARAHDRAQTLCWVLINMVFRDGWSDPERARHCAEEALRLARQSDDPLDLPKAYMGLAWERMYRGAMPEAREAYTRSIALLRGLIAEGVQVRQARRRLAWALVSFAALVLWPMGYADQARALGDEAERMTRETGHPLTFLNVGYYQALLRALCGETGRARCLAEETLAAAANPEERADRFLPLRLFRTWSLLAEGEGVHPEQTLGLLDEIRRDVESDPKIAWGQVYLLADCYRRLGHLDEAIDAANLGTSRAFLLFGFPAAVVLRGETLLERDEDEEAAEADFRSALETARTYGYKSVEIMAATSLARLLHAQGRREEALQVLAPAYAWFTEGFDTVNLREARLLLNELGDTA